MATLVKKPEFSATMPDVEASGLALLNSITANKIWAETSLQYFFGDSNAVDLDSRFERDLTARFPDASLQVAFNFATEATRAYQIIDSVSNLDFSQTFDTALADDVLISVVKPGSRIAAFFEFPGTSFHDANPTTDSWSFGAFNCSRSMLTLPELGGGNFATTTLLHEIGHSLGLKHTHKETDGLPPLDTVGEYMDNERYSVMSYHRSSNAASYGHAVSFMALDIAALQALYGAEAYATASTGYSLAAAQSTPLNVTEFAVIISRAYYCIWDTAGTDSIGDFSLDKSVLINLNDATLDTAEVAPEVRDVIAAVQRTDFYDHLSKDLQQEIIDPWHHAGGFFSRILEARGHHNYEGTDGGFSIAHGVQIEQAIGGNAADLLIGNEGANKLDGGGGDDTLLGSGGGDSMIGGTENDYLDGGKGDDLLDGGGGRDTFVFGKNYGVDEIVAFEHHSDLIDLSGMHEVKNFAYVKNHMTTVQNGNETFTQIVLDHAKLIIDNTKPADFTAADFII